MIAALIEGIETRSDLATLAEMGVEFGQGFLIGRPEADPVVPRRGQVLRLAGGRDRLAPAVGDPFIAEAAED